jgi:hypothetical protein
MNILSSITSSISTISNISNQFTNAFDNKYNESKYSNDLIQGENGSLTHSTSADTVYDFDGILCDYFLIMRDTQKDKIIDILNRLVNIIDSKLISENKRKEFLIKLLKISLFIREPRKGKGERDIFYHIINYLYELNGDYRKLAITMIEMIENFGYFKDYNNLFINTQNVDLKKYLLEKYTEILIKDKQKENVSELTLAAKWAPREGSKYDKFAKELAQNIFKNTNFNKSYKSYRQMLSDLNKKLNTVQPIMCQKHWADIDFSKVSSVSMTNLTKAFQDEKVNPFPKSKRLINIKRRPIKNNDNRRHHPGDTDYDDRQKCRENLINHIQKGKKINASVTNLSTIVNNYLQHQDMDITWEAQWDARISEIQTMISQLERKPKIFPMVDLSSSMNGSPIINAITLGLFTSTILDNPLDQEEFCFSNRFMSFASEPNLVKLPRFSALDNTQKATLKEKITIMREWTKSGKWGGSTNIHAALDLLLNIATSNNVPQKDMPDILAIFSDMQFDQGDSAWTKTTYDNISNKFKNSGYEMPHILFWNLRGNTDGYQVKANTPNSSMLSGYSTRMVDLFLSGNLDELKNISDNTKTDNTIDLINKALTHSMFEKYNDAFDRLF